MLRYTDKVGGWQRPPWEGVFKQRFEEVEEMSFVMSGVKHSRPLEWGGKASKRRSPGRWWQGLVACAQSKERLTWRGFSHKGLNRWVPKNPYVPIPFSWRTFLLWAILSAWERAERAGGQGSWLSQSKGVCLQEMLNTTAQFVEPESLRAMMFILWIATHW